MLIPKSKELNIELNTKYLGMADFHMACENGHFLRNGGLLITILFLQRSKILVEWEIRQVVVDVEEESILVILGWLRVRNPKQFIYSNVIS